MHTKMQTDHCPRCHSERFLRVSHHYEDAPHLHGLIETNKRDLPTDVKEYIDAHVKPDSNVIYCLSCQAIVDLSFRMLYRRK